MSLNRLFKKYGCDKGIKHGYGKVYSKEWESLREEPINFLEIGIYEGLSTKAFIEYFPNATIYGIDTFQRIFSSQIPILSHERVKWLQADSMSYNIKRAINQTWPDVQFDIILDDGNHMPEAQSLTFRNLSPFLKETGMYLIEDVFPFHIMSGKDMNLEWVQDNPETLNYLKFQLLQKAIDGWETQEFDLRSKSGQPDSYIFKMTKKKMG